MNPHSIMRLACVFLPLCAATGIAEAQSIAASLSDYEATLRVTSVAGVSAKSFSGVAFHPETRTLYVIDNDNAMVYELNTSGALLRSIATSGFTDPEGIVYQGDDWFLISEEGLANIVRVKLPRTGAGPVAKSGGKTLNISSNLANSGIEGVAYRAADKTAYAVQETGPSRLYRIGLDTAGNPIASFPNDPFNIEGKSGDAADIYALSDGNFIFVNQEQNKLEGYGPAGQALASLALGMGKPEGIAIDTADGTIYIVGEPLEFTVLRNKKATARNLASIGNGFSCSLAAGNGSRAAPALRYTLPYRTSVRIDFAAANGTWAEVFADRVDQGEHVFGPRGLTSAVGVGYFLFSAGSFQRVVKFARL